MDLKIVLLIISSYMMCPCSGFSSSLCQGCGTNHKLNCSAGYQIDITGAYYAYTPINRKCTKSQTCVTHPSCCEYLDGDCMVHYFGQDVGNIMKCSGKESCSVPSISRPRQSNKCRDSNDTFYYMNAYTEISYRCVPEPVPFPFDGWNYMTALQVVIDGMKPYLCSYRILSIYYNLFHTNPNCTGFLIHGDNSTLRCNTHYRITGSTNFTIKPFTDIYIVLTGHSQFYNRDTLLPVSVQYKCNDSKPTTSGISGRPPTPITTISTKDTFKAEIYTESPVYPTTKDTNESFLRRTERQSDERKGNDGAVIAAGILGAILLLLLLLLIIGIVFVMIKRRKQSTSVGNGHHGIENPGYNTPNSDLPSVISGGGDNQSVQYSPQYENVSKTQAGVNHAELNLSDPYVG